MLHFPQSPKQKQFQCCVLLQLDKCPQLWNLNQFCWRHHSVMDQIHSMSAIMFKSNPFNLAISYNYFSTHRCEDCTKNGLISTLWSISSDAARFTLTSCCDTAFLMPFTKLNNIDDKAREYKPLRQQTAPPLFFFFYRCSNSLYQPWTWI